MTAADPGGFPLYDDPPEDPYAGSETEESEPDGWAPLDLGPYIRGEVVPVVPTVGVARWDKLRFLYPGKEHAVIGEMESGKSWFALACAAAELIAGHAVVYVHFEESDPSDSIERLLALGVPPWTIEKLFRFVTPDRPAALDSIGRLLEPVPSLSILDGVNEGMSLHGHGVREEEGVATFRRRLVKPFTRAGTAVLACDHVVKDSERRGRNALGSIHKGNALSGSLILLENEDPFGRGERGCSHVYVTKDRPGHLRRHGRPDRKVPGKTYMGALVVDDRQLRTPDLFLAIFAPSDTKPEPTAAADTSDDDRVLSAVAAVVKSGNTTSIRAVRAAAGIGKDKVDMAIERLKLAGKITEKPGARNARVFTVAEDQPSGGGK